MVRLLRKSGVGDELMRSKDIIDTCEQLEYMARRGRELTIGHHPDGEVTIQRPEDRALLFILEWIWSLRPEGRL
jgi:hypothetical protein